MQTILSTTFDAMKRNAYSNVSLSVVTSLSETFTITNADILAGSFQINRSSASSNVLEIGSVDSSELKFSVDNHTGKFNAYKFEGAEVTVTYTVNGESFCGGIFTIDNKPTKKEIFAITALDNICKLDKPYVSDLSFSDSIKDILQEIEAKCGVVIVTNNLRDELNYVTVVPADIDTTYHEVLCWACQLLGVNAFADYRGYIVLGWYGEQQLSVGLPDILPFKLGGFDYNGIEIPIDGSVRFQYEANETNLTITGIEYDNGTDAPVGYPSLGTANPIVISDNPLVNTNNVIDVLTMIYDKIGGFTYRPCKMTTAGFPHLWAMDIVKVTAPDGEVYNTVVTDITHKLNGNSVLQAAGESETRTGYASPSAKFTATQIASIRSNSRKQSDIVLTQYDQAVLEATSNLNTSHGFYETKTYAEDGSITAYYQHDQPTLAASMIVTKITEGYVGKSTDGGATYTTTISAAGATIPQLTARFVYADQVVVGGQGTSGELTVRNESNEPLIILDKSGITMADGTSIIGGNGVKSTFVFRTDNFAKIGFYNVSESEGIISPSCPSIDYYIPSNFYIESAILYLCIYPQYALNAVFDTELYTGYGKPTGVTLNLQSDIRNNIHTYFGYADDTGDTGSVTDITYSAFGASSLTPTTPSQPPYDAVTIGTNYTSSNIASYLTNGSGRVIFKEPEPTLIPDHYTRSAFLVGGNITANLVVIGYKI